MRSTYKPLSECIREIKERNFDGSTNTLLGINIDKYFMPSVANVIGTDLSVYKIVKNGQFACNRMHVGRDKRLPVALSRSNTDFIVSPAYDVFEIIDESILSPEYLMMWFSRKEFDRNAWFYTDADVRGGLSWDAFCNMHLPVPAIEKQKEIVKEYNTIVDRIRINELFYQKLKETAQTIYKQWFEEFEFPNENRKTYRASGGEMVYNAELDKEIPKGWNVVSLSEISNCYDNQRKPLSETEREGIKGCYPYYGAMSIVDYINDYIYDGIYLLFSEDGVNVVDKNGHPALQYIWGKFWLNNHAHIIQGKDGYSTEYLYLVLKNTNVAHLVTGAAQPKINQENMNSIRILKPNISCVKAFIGLIEPLFKHLRVLSEFNNSLLQTKGILLSKLAV